MLLLFVLYVLALVTIEDNEDHLTLGSTCNRFLTCSFFSKDDQGNDNNSHVPVEKWTKLDKKCVILLQNLINEQVTNNFHTRTAEENIESGNLHQFKFFLNTLEIFCHSLNIINQDNYFYRIKSYGKYEKALKNIPRTLDKGSFINLQTYKSTIENEVSSFMKKKYDLMMKQNCFDEEFSRLYKEYSYYATQYQRYLREIFRELHHLSMIMTEMAKDLGSDKIMSSAVYLEGLIHPKNKYFYESQIKELLQGFERTIRHFEQSRISCTCAIVDLYYREAFSPQLEIKSEDISRIYPISNITSALSTQRKPFPEEQSAPNPSSLNKILSESILSGKSSMVNEPRKRLVLNDISIDQNASNILPTERDYDLTQRAGSLHTLLLTGRENKSKSINHTGKKFSCITPILKNRDAGFQLGIDFNKTVANTEYITSLNTKKNSLVSFQSKKKNLFLTSFENKENEANFVSMSDNSRLATNEISNLFKENKFYKGKLNTASSLLKFR